MITILNESPNIIAADAVTTVLDQSYTEVCTLLPTLPASINIWLDNSVLIAETGEGGFAYSPDTITVAFDMEYADKVAQLQSLRATMFHEAYHLIQGHTHEDAQATYTTALDSAIYEGMATVFERQYAGSKPLWGEYSAVDEQTLTRWRDSLHKLAIEDYLNPHTGKWQQWAFFDETDNERWKLYKTGTWIVDTYLQRTGKDIINIVHMPASEIIKAS